jgi:hypothetical protein
MTTTSISGNGETGSNDLFEGPMKVEEGKERRGAMRHRGDKEPYGDG